ncbi:testis-specific Y-encoded protein 3-like [Tamandua tetradactyla]|uniref:testis-specific Y-encoded protein 3-like n=1 Tax=Tamandua tetradactyla TaxID=48850 RepID=UPI0040542433
MIQERDHMASEERSGFPDNHLKPAGGLLVGESVGPRGEQSPESSSAGAEAQAAAVREVTEGPSEETAILWVGMGPEIEKLEVRVEIEIRGETGLVNEDGMETVAVVTEEDVKEPQERQKEKEQVQSDLGPSRTRPFLEALEALRLEMEPVNARARRAFSRLRRNMWQRRKSHLESRSAIIQGFPGFWVKAILNHPQMSAVITEQDEDMLNYMTNLEVEEINQPKNFCKITFFFRSNPYFQNEVIIKEYDVDITGFRASHSTPIRWFQNFECQAYSRRHQNTSPNFFNWFSDHNFTGSNRFAEIISEDLWLNPMQYYPREEETRSGNGDNRAPSAFDVEMIEYHSLPKITQDLKCYFKNGK